MKGFILFIIAVICLIIFGTIGFLWQVIRSLFSLGTYFYNVAYTIDQSGNVIASHLLNDCLVKKGGSLFGNPDLTVSGTLGLNKKSGTLTWLGRLIASGLDDIEKNHVENAIEKDEKTETKF